VLTIGTDGREVSLNVLSPGDAFGELALVRQTPRSASVRASTPLELFQLDRSFFQALTRVYPALSETLEVDARALMARLIRAVGAPPLGDAQEVQCLDRRNLDSGTGFASAEGRRPAERTTTFFICVRHS